MDASIHSRNPSIAQLRRRGDLIAAKAVGCLILLCMSLSVAPSAVADPVRNVLVIYSDNRLLPANLEVDAALREALVGPTKSGVELYTEFLDRSRFAGAEYEATTSAYLAEKYANALPEVVVAGGEYALRFLTDHRAALFPSVPIVFVGLSPAEIEALGPLPNDVIGVPVEFDYGGTIDQALRFHPNATRLILITGANRFDRRDEVELAGIVPRLNGRVSVESLSGLPIDAIVKRVRALSGTDIVFTPGFFTDGAGRQFSPRESAQIIAEASRAPGLRPIQHVHRIRHRWWPHAELQRDRQRCGRLGKPSDRRRTGEFDRSAGAYGFGTADRLAAGAPLGDHRETTARRRGRSLQGADVLGSVRSCSADCGRRDHVADRS